MFVWGGGGGLTSVCPRATRHVESSFFSHPPHAHARAPPTHTAGYDAQKTTPAFEFGFGLSYSTFSYSALTSGLTLTPAAGVTVYATVCNTAGPAGAEVAQLYVGYPAAANEPPKLLKGFEKLALGPGDCSGVGFPLEAKDLWVWDVTSQAWQLIPGTYNLYVGASSRDIRLTGTLSVTA